MNQNVSQSTITDDTPISPIQKREVRQIRLRIQLWIMEVNVVQINNRRLKRDLRTLLPQLFECSRGCKTINQYEGLLRMMGSAESLMDMFERARNQPPNRPRQQRNRRHREHRNGPQRRQRQRNVRRFL